ncbi:hypothetical protein DL765_005677 [Monosporascus sp. GIB2]|nr:hypothetical protein DL765_005677 [Monosporascus sp. GIB2]
MTEATQRGGTQQLDKAEVRSSPDRRVSLARDKLERDGSFNLNPRVKFNLDARNAEERVIGVMRNAGYYVIR